MELLRHIQDMALAVHDGKADAAQTYGYLYHLRKEIDVCIDTIKGLAVEEVEKYGSQGITAHGYKLTAKNAAGRWSYKNVNVHAEILAELKTIEQMAQAAAKTGAHVVRPDGVIVEAATYTPGGLTINANAIEQPND